MYTKKYLKYKKKYLELKKLMTGGASVYPLGKDKEAFGPCFYCKNLGMHGYKMEGSDSLICDKCVGESQIKGVEKSQENKDLSSELPIGLTEEDKKNILENERNILEEEERNKKYFYMDWDNKHGNYKWFDFNEMKEKYGENFNIGGLLSWHPSRKTKNKTDYLPNLYFIKGEYAEFVFNTLYNREPTPEELDNIYQILPENYTLDEFNELFGKSNNNLIDYVYNPNTKEEKVYLAQEDVTSQSYTKEMTIDENCIGIILGKNGKKIKALNKKYNSTFENQKITLKNKERKLTMKGDSKKELEDIEKEILKLIKKCTEEGEIIRNLNYTIEHHRIHLRSVRKNGVENENTIDEQTLDDFNDLMIWNSKIKKQINEITNKKQKTVLLKKQSTLENELKEVQNKIKEIQEANKTLSIGTIIKINDNSTCKITNKKVKYPNENYNFYPTDGKEVLKKGINLKEGTEIQICEIIS